MDIDGGGISLTAHKSWHIQNLMPPLLGLLFTSVQVPVLRYMEYSRHVHDTRGGGGLWVQDHGAWRSLDRY